jgi:hypothetical protein
MPPERTCLHLCRLTIGKTEAPPDGIDVHCPLALDMMYLLENHLPAVLEEALPILDQEGVRLV